MNTNLILLYKQFLGRDFKIYNKKYKKSLKRPVVFFTIIDFLDDETIYELKHVCKEFSDLMKLKIEVDYKVLKMRLERIRLKKVS